MTPGLGCASAGAAGGASAWRVTQAATWAREFTSSFSRTCSRWPSTVRSEMKRRPAISRLVNPSATSRAISSSRRLRRTEPFPIGVPMGRPY